MIFFDVLLDALLDTAKLLPFLIAVYYLIEVLEYKNVFKFEKSKLLTGKASPVVGALFGVVPQCGFSVVSAELYAKKKMSISALIAVFIATSDEALPILISNYKSIPILAILLFVKFLIAIIVGYFVMIFAKKVLSENGKSKKKEQIVSKNLSNKSDYEISKKVLNEKTEKDKNGNIIHSEFEKNNEHKENEKSNQNNINSKNKNHNHDLDEEHYQEEHNHEENENHEHADHEQTHEENGEVHENHSSHLHACCHHDIENKNFNWQHPLVHTVKIALYIFVINLVLGLFVALIGEENIANFLTKSSVFQPVLALVIGIIPNCASSVILTELFMQGLLSFGSIITGLGVNAGIGFLVLLKENKSKKENIFIIATIVISSLIFGYAFHFLPFNFLKV